jgi:hypothetical protein
LSLHPGPFDGARSKISLLCGWTTLALTGAAGYPPKVSAIGLNPSGVGTVLVSMTVVSGRLLILVSVVVMNCVSVRVSVYVEVVEKASKN